MLRILNTSEAAPVVGASCLPETATSRAVNNKQPMITFDDPVDAGVHFQERSNTYRKELC